MDNKYITAIDNGPTYDLHNILNGRIIKQGISIARFNDARELIPSFIDSLPIPFKDDQMWQGNKLNSHRIKAHGEVYQGVEPIGRQLVWIRRMDSLNTQFEVVSIDGGRLINCLTLSQAEWVITHIANSLIDFLNA